MNDTRVIVASTDDPHAHRRKPSFHRGDVVNYNPNRTDYYSPTFLQDYLLKGWTPAAPILTRDTKITAFGSCFAANITRHLSSIGYSLSSKREPDIYISRIGDGLVNTAAILGQFEWALENKKQATDLWHGREGEGFGYDEDVRVRTRDVFLTTEFFVITFGLSEIWYDEKTGGTFWRAVPARAFDPSRHKFRVLSMEETKADIASMHRLIRTHVPNAKILFTVSPVPLSATFRPVACLTANHVSKAIIRAALDEFLRSRPDELGKTLFYFPSMEIVQLAFIDAWAPDARHPRQYVLDTVMKTFEAAYCVGEATLEDANRMLQTYRALNMREIAERLEETSESRATVDAARKAARAGRDARKEARQRDKKLAFHSQGKRGRRAQAGASRRGEDNGALNGHEEQGGDAPDDRAERRRLRRESRKRASV